MIRFFLPALLAAILLVPNRSSAQYRFQWPDELRCEYRDNPQGIDIAHPRLSWKLKSSGGRGLKQAAYRICVATSAEKLRGNSPDAWAPDLWDSGKVESDADSQIEYAGKPLLSHQQCYWNVQVWCTSGRDIVKRAPQHWSMGIVDPADWKAHWIGYDAAATPDAQTLKDDSLFTTQGLPWMHNRNSNLTKARFRKRFELPVDRKIRRAVLAISADNICHASVNGTELGEAVRWDKSARLDATALLKPGANEVQLAAENTDYMAAAVTGRLVIQFASGGDMVLPIDPSWESSAATGKEDVDAHAPWSPSAAQRGTPWGTSSLADVPRVPAPYFRKTFQLDQPVKRATATTTALGCYELHLNGKKVGRDLLTPGWTDFHKRVYYQTYDVTAQLQPGENAVGAILGDGWYASDLAFIGHRKYYGGNPRLFVQIDCEMADGSHRTIATDNTWKASYGPILHADLLLGAEFDARKVLTGWDTAQFNDTAWQPVLVDAASSKGPMQIQAAPAEPLRAQEELTAVKVTEPKPGCYTFDLGQNMVGWVRLKIHGQAGQRVTLRHGEMLNPDGAVYTANLRGATAADFFTLTGGDDLLEPPFTFHGFRYVEIRGLTQKPMPEMVTGVVVHTDMHRTGQFECSSELVNKLYHNIIWGQKGNYFEVPTDCPQRDERMGWTGDTQFFAPTAAYNFDVAPFFTRWLVTMCEDSQHPDGSYAHVAPDMGCGSGATAWGDAAIICTYNMYRVYGDKRVIEAHWAAMERYMRWMSGKSRDYVPKIGGFGDWLSLGGGASREVIDTAYFAMQAEHMGEMARAIGRNDDADRYDALHKKIKSAFARFFAPDGALRNCSQTGYALAFTMNLVPEELKDKAAQHYAAEVARFHDHLATGFIGTPRLLPGLHKAGRDDVAYRLLLQETYPSWLFQVKLGATTMWERWNGWTPDHGFESIGMNSFNHYAFGAVGEYLYGSVAGIQAESPGYKTIRIQPIVGDGLTWAKASVDTIHGRVASSWKRDGDVFTLDVTIPANTVAHVYLPVMAGGKVTESGHEVAASNADIKALPPEKDSFVCEVAEGTYSFRAAK